MGNTENKPIIIYGNNNENDNLNKINNNKKIYTIDQIISQMDNSMNDMKNELCCPVWYFIFLI